MESIQSNIQVSLPDQASLNHQEGPRLKMSNYKPIRYLTGDSTNQVLLVENKASRKLSTIKIHRKHDREDSNQVESNVRDLIDLLIWRDQQFPFWCKFLGVILENRYTGFVFEFVLGESLQSLAKRSGGMKPDEAKFYIAEILLSLNYLHEHSIVHNDVESENVMITETGHTKLINFSRSEVVEDQEKYWNKYKTRSGNQSINPYFNDWISLGALTDEIITSDYQDYHGWEDCLSFIKQTQPSDQRISKMNLFHHPWFKDLHWYRVKNLEYKPPYLPEIQNLQQLGTDLPAQLIPDLIELGMSE
ncbi:kinase-like domain-containing protein [Melampsora americana]|nr:kinase-like domain-containing protein [Melampsora americana]